MLNLLSTFKEAKVEHVRREQNTRADLLAKLASTKNKNHYHSVIQMTVPTPSISHGEEVMNIEEDKGCWMILIIKFLKEDTCEETEETAMKRKCTRYTLIGDELYRKSYSRPLLKCINKSRAKYVMAELHEGICGLYSGGRSMATRALRAGYYWPTMESDAAEYVKKCKKCQEFGNILRVKPEVLHHMNSSWPFVQWGIDIIGALSLGKGQCKFLLVVVDYFTKWIEVEPLASITTNKVQSFVWKNIICMFGLPNTIISDNGRQFID